MCVSLLLLVRCLIGVAHRTTLVELPLLTLVPDDTRLQLLAALHPRTLAKEADVKVTDMANVLLAAKHQWSMLPAPFQAAFVQAMTQQADADHRVLVKAFRLLPLMHFSLRCELPTDTRQSFLQMLQRKVARLNAEELESVLQGYVSDPPAPAPTRRITVAYYLCLSLCM